MRITSNGCADCLAKLCNIRSSAATRPCVGKLQTPCLDELSAPFDVSRTVRENKKTTRRIELSDRSLIIVRSHWRTMNEMTLSERFKCVRQISATDVQRDDGAVLIAQLT